MIRDESGRICKESLRVLLCYDHLKVTVGWQNTVAAPSLSNHTYIFVFLIIVQQTCEQKSTQLLPNITIPQHSQYVLCPDCLCWPRYGLDDRPGLLFLAGVKSVLFYKLSELLFGGYRGYNSWGTRLSTHRQMGVIWPSLQLNSYSTIQLHGIVLIAGLHPQSPRHFAWRSSVWVSQFLRSSYNSHMIAAAT